MRGLDTLAPADGMLGATPHPPNARPVARVFAS
jgi:hypothetical protein